MTKYTPPEEASGAASLAISYKLPLDIEAKLSEDELRLFYSLSEDQQRLSLKQAGVIPSVSGTAATANKLARFGLNRQAAPNPRKKPSGPLKRTLENLITEITGDFDAVIDAFKVDAVELRNAAPDIARENTLGDLRRAGMAFIRVQEVDERYRYVYPQSLDGLEMKPVSFKRIKNILAEIKKPIPG
jgi:hypothetical protein